MKSINKTFKAGLMLRLREITVKK